MQFSAATILTFVASAAAMAAPAPSPSAGVGPPQIPMEVCDSAVPHRDGPISFNGSVPQFSFEELYELGDGFLKAFMSPNNADEAKKINSTIFSEDVIGRVDATRNFVGRELNTEYVFGLFSQLALNPKAFSLLGTPKDYKITHFTANQNIISLDTIVNFYIVALDVTTPVEIVFWATFNEQKQITQYDATFRYLQWQFDYLFEVGQKKFNVHDPAQFVALVAGQLANSICDTAMASCNGTSQQYESKEACTAFLTQQVPFGEAYKLGFDSLLCRMVHQPMVPIQPELHCPHIGPSGGEYCISDRTYSQNVEEPLFKLQPFVPYGYADKNKTVAAQK